MIDTRNIRNTLLAVVGVLILAIGVYGAGFYYIKSQVEETSMLAQELEQKQAERTNLQDTLRVVEETRDTRAQLDRYFVNASNVVVFIERLESLGDNAGVTATINNLREAQNGELDLSIQAQGAVANVLHYTEMLEYLPLNMTIDQVQLQQAGDNWSATYTGTITSFISHSDD